MVLQHDRRSIAIAPGEEGSSWNKWILGACAAPLYLDLIQYLMGISGADGYRHWPEYQPLEPESVSNILAMTFWKLINNGTHSPLYPPNRLLPTSDGISNEHTTPVLDMSEATFNLLDTEIERDFFLSLLLELGLETIVTPSNTVRSGLKELRPPSMRSITPRFLMDFVRGSPRYSERLLEIWRDHDHSIEYFNQLLSFIISSGTSLSLLIDCPLLPLANRTLGVFLQETAEQTYLMADTAEEYEILQISKSLMVHPGLDRSIASRLSSSTSLNVRYFQSADIKKLYPSLDIHGRDDQYRKEWLVKVWSYLGGVTRNLPGTERYRLDPLQDVRVYFGKVVSAVSDEDVFLCPSEFDNYSRAAILAPSEITEEEIAVIRSFNGLILLDRLAFPDGRVRVESLQNVKGVYRLLRSISLLASTDQLPSIEAYITRTVPDRITVRYFPRIILVCSELMLELKTLREIFSPAIFAELMANPTVFPQARECLRELPLWPSTHLEIPIHRPATRALLPPYPILSRSGMTHDDIFVDDAVAQQYSEQLEHLGVTRMTIDFFLREHVGVIQDCQIHERRIPYFERLIDILTRVRPRVFSEQPLGVDGNGRFQWLDSLYSPDEPIFVAAFRDPRHFLHQQYRDFPGWAQSPLVREVTEASYLACVLSIHERATASETEDGLPVDAGIVFGYLCHEDRLRDREVEQWSLLTWTSLSGIEFAPIKTIFDDPRHRHRVLRMTELLAGKAITKVTDAIIPDYMDVAWSQYPILEISPSAVVIRNLPTAGVSSSTVLNHLIFLWQGRGNVEAEHIRDYVMDIEKSYQWLQNILQYEGDFSIAQEAEVWFNADLPDILEMTPGEFQASWLSSRDLCIGLEHDLLPLRHVGSFLTPYHRLMARYGVKTMKGPNIPSLLHSAVDHTSLVLDGFRKLQKDGWSWDVKIVLEGQEFHAHCAVLCAMSGYWTRYLSARSRGAEKTHTFPVGSKVKPESVSALLDYIYTGKVSNTESLGVYSEDLHNVVDQLYLSNEWELEELKAELELSLCKSSWIRPDFIYSILKCAEYVGAKDLLGICNQYVEENREIVDQMGIVVPSWDWYPVSLKFHSVGLQLIIFVDIGDWESIALIFSTGFW